MSKVEIGSVIAEKYRIIRVLGTGGWGVVYEGENLRTLHKVAIKVLHAEMSVKAEMIARFEREAQAAGKIGSDHIIEVYDLGELADGERFMVMELLQGQDLGMRLAGVGRMAPEVLVPMMVQVLEGLGAAHDAGILHRDLKPENLFLVNTKGGGDFVKILDFGISKFGHVSSTMTLTGAVMGSPCYMSPEQARGSKDLDGRSDLFSLGIVLFECATGRLPFAAENFNELLFKIALTEVAPDPILFRPDLDPEFAAIIRKALAREASARFDSAADFQAALTEWMDKNGVISGDPARLRKATTPRSSGKQPVVADPQHGLSETMVDLRSVPEMRVAADADGPPQPDSRSLRSSGRRVTTVSNRPPRRRLGLLVAPLVAVLLVLGIVVRARRTTGASPQGIATPAAATATPPSPPAPTPSATATSAETPAASASTAPASVPSVLASAPAPVPASSPTGARRPRRAPGVTTVAAPTPAEPVAPVASSAAAPLPSVEGRRIRTGL